MQWELLILPKGKERRDKIAVFLTTEKHFVFSIFQVETGETCGE